MNDETYWDAVCLLLPNSQHTIIDSTDFEVVSRHRWFSVRNDGGKRRDIRRNCGPRKKKKTVLLPRFLLDAPKGKLVDHINNNPVDNRRKNLRLCTSKQNSRNRRKLFPTGSKYKGVNPDKRSGKFRAFIYVNNCQMYLGTFQTEIQAALTYNEAAHKFHGEFARPNVIECESERAV